VQNLLFHDIGLDVVERLWMNVEMRDVNSSFSF